MNTSFKAALMLGASALGVSALGAATFANAQTAEQTAEPAPAACNAQSCVSAEGPLVEITTRGLRQPVTTGTTAASSSEALQPDRRVAIEAERAGQAVAAGRWSMQLPDGGAIWVVEDPTLGQARMNLSAPATVAFEAGRIVSPVRFQFHSNYPAFIERADIRIYRATDVDMVTPLAVIPVTPAALSEVEWDGALPAGTRLNVDDELVYVVRAHGANGAFDETFPHRLRLATPEEVNRGLTQMREQAERLIGTAMDASQAQRMALTEQAMGENALRLQNIPLHGSRVRIAGRNIHDGYGVRIDGQNHPVDLERKFVAEYLVPVGQHSFELELSGQDLPPLKRRFDVDVSGNYFFGVGLADLTLSSGKVRGSRETLGQDSSLDDDFLVEGRLAAYLKAKFKARYLLTAQVDTQERELENLFDKFWSADPQDVFRRLDPDTYYAVYGDDSTTTRDVDTQGRLYVRMDWDKNQALFGNFNTGITGNEYAQYNRALYGGAVNLRSNGTTQLGEATSQLKAFASEAQTAYGHSSFLATGGSLYYFKHTDLLPGSDRLVVEVRDPTTGRVENRVELLRGADYDIDSLQGRVILTRPLAQIAREGMTGITRTQPLDGYEQILLADYEYVPSGVSLDEITTGVRGRHWFGDHVGVGLTYVDEKRAGDDYNLAGVDLTLQAHRGTWLKIEHAMTEATAAPVFYSDNGGLSFNQTNAFTGPREGKATSVEGRVNLRELGVTQTDWTAGAWWRQVDQGYSVTRTDIGKAVEEIGAELQADISDRLKLYARHTEAERGEESLTQSQITTEWQMTDTQRLGAELRRLDERRTSGRAEGTLAALQYSQRLFNALEVAATGQLTLDDDGGAYESNDLLTLSGRYLFADQSSVGVEGSTGDRGEALQVNVERRLSPDHTVYAGYTFSSDTTAVDPLFDRRANSGWTAGQRWRLSNRVNLFNESQQLKTATETGLSHTYGMDFYPSEGWNLGFTVQRADLERHIDDALVQRTAISLNGGHTSRTTQWQSRLEWREDTGAEQREQWVTTHRLSHKLNESLRIAGRVNYSRTEDMIDAKAGAEFLEANLGFALRPWNTTRWAMFGKLTVVEDVSALEQTGENVAFYDQKSRIASLEGVFNPEPRWEVAAKLMVREGEVRFGRMEGQWADSNALFGAVQVRHALSNGWHSMAEYRLLDVKDGGARQGFMVGVDRDISDHMRIGVGYNFTDFSDDLTDYDYDHRGVFINVTGRF